VAPTQPGSDDRGLIETALRVVQIQRTCSADEAEAILLQTALATNTSVSGVAGAVVRTEDETRSRALA